MKIVALNGFTEGEQFFRYLRDTFDQLAEEGGRMMSIGLHGRIAGAPAGRGRWRVFSTMSGQRRCVDRHADRHRPPLDRAATYAGGA
jgi:peptidoglycan/xylan/chitin deacetylase (PgdA/CDA1 family)